jgi:hypothetical protein
MENVTSVPNSPVSRGIGRADREYPKMTWNPDLPSSGKEEPRAYRILTYIFAVLFIPLGLAFVLMYKVAFSWWLTAILAKKHQEAFIRKVRTRLAFLFEEHVTEVVSSEPTRELPGWYFAVATLKSDNLRLRILEKNGGIAVQIAPDFAPNDWNELEATLCAVGANEKGGRCSYVGFYDLEKLLRQNLPLLESAFQKENYEYYKKLIDNIEIPKKKFQKSYLDWLFGRSPSATWHL